MTDFKIHTLGCGSAKPSLIHNPSCTVVEHGKSLYMIDCGEGAQLEFQRAGLRVSRLSDIFITHLHGDHVLGLPGFISSLGLNDRRSPLTIHTFKEGKEFLSAMFNFFSPNLCYDVNFNVIAQAEDVIFDNGLISVRTIPLIHRIADVGFVFEEKIGRRHILPDMIKQHDVPVNMIRDIQEGNDFIKENGEIIPNETLTAPPSKPRSYAHISDTIYIPDIHEKIGSVSLLFHETTYTEINREDARRHYHSTARQAATVARDAGAGALLTGHYSTRYRDDNVFLTEAQEVFPHVILNREGLNTDIGR